ncbi:MAG TPA: 3-dehydroquinate synthase [Verrucomicrobiae bacterium]|jgi:3-dehydroquinate synthase
MSAILRSIRVGWQLRVFFTEDVFSEKNLVLKNALADHRPRRVLVVLEDALAQSQPALESQIEKYFSTHAGQLQLARTPLFVPGGESSKNSVTIVTDILAQVDKHHIDRQSYLIAVGGGALLDIAGFAAATAHRGVRHVRIPTTTLSQADSGVGVKNSINAFGKKNFVGTFAPPNAVINDFNLLATLKPREKRAGYVEAVKVACIHDAEFFEMIERDMEKLNCFEPAAVKKLIRRCAELHLEHIATSGDPFETSSARPLDFGHWAAHKLEQLSNFRMPHAEAVAIGIALDVIYSRKIGLLSERSCERVIKLLAGLGFDLFACELLGQNAGGDYLLLAGLEEFREHLGGELTVTLLKGIGAGVEVNEMHPKKIIASIHELQERAGKK